MMKERDVGRRGKYMYERTNASPAPSSEITYHNTKQSSDKRATWLHQLQRPSILLTTHSRLRTISWQPLLNQVTILPIILPFRNWVEKKILYPVAFSFMPTSSLLALTFSSYICGLMMGKYNPLTFYFYSFLKSFTFVLYNIGDKLIGHLCCRSITGGGPSVTVDLNGVIGNDGGRLKFGGKDFSKVISFQKL